MPSQEDYLDKLLKGIDESVSMEGDSTAADALDLGDLSNLGDLSGIGDLSDIGVLSDLGDLPDIGVMPDLGDLPDIGEAPDMGDFFDLDDLPSLDDLPDIASLLGAVELPDAGEASSAGELPDFEGALDAVELPDTGEISSMAELPDAGEASSAGELPDFEGALDAVELPDTGEISSMAELPEAEEVSSAAELPDMEEVSSAAELPDMEEVSSVSELPDLEDILGVEEPDGGDIMAEAGELSGMSEEDVEQALQVNRTEPQPEEAAPDVSDEDLMNLLKEADNSELQDIHDMLQKSDNNEALEDILAENQGNPGAGEAAAQNPEAEENPDGLSERQRKALEKKRLKEEKAAAKKAAKEAKKAEKLAKKAGKPQEDMQAAVPAPEAQERSELNEDGTAMEEALSVDMSAIDDLLEFSDDHGEADIADAAAAASGGKKKGLFARILDFLTEEDEDEEEEPKEKGTENIPLSDENKNILAEMDKEEPGKKGKKGKKEKKPRKGKAGAEDAENEGEGDEEGGKKAKKAKKPPKEKKPREDVPKGAKKKLPVKQLMPIILTCVTVLFVVLLLVNLGGDFTVKRNARKAYYQEDYETCYQELYGRTLNESEQVMFGKSESILRIRLWMREYELFSGEGAEAEALDILIQSVKDYAQLYEYAVQWNAEGEVSAVYGQMLDILQNKYGLTEAQALEIAAEPDDVEYTKLVTAVAQGQGYHPDGASLGAVELPHMLPEEKQFPENNGGQ